MRIDVLKAVGWKIVIIITTTIIIIISITISTDSGGMAVTVKCNGLGVMIVIIHDII